MAKKIVKKRKIKFLNLFIILIVLGVIGYSIYFSTTIPIKNIVIKNTDYLNDDYIMELSSIINYPSFIKTNTKKVKSSLEKSDYISNVSVKKKWGYILEIDVVENKPLFYNMNDSKFILTNNESVVDDSINSNFRVPRLINYVPDKKYKKFVKEMAKVNPEVLSKISDIEYKPNDYDKDRFLLYMDDSNVVYLTLTKFKMINHYNDVLSQLDNHKGILYLDNGNHFQIME